MIIQCRQCNSNYKIDPQKLPAGKSFIRCSKCSASIPISREEQDKVTNESPKKIIHCDQCQVRYAIPLSHFKTDIIKVHCGKCGFVFRISKDQPDEKRSEDDLTGKNRDTREDIGLEDVKISKDEGIEMNNLFDDISDESADESSISETPVEEEYTTGNASSRPQTPTEEYLDAVKLSASEGSESIDFGLGTISSSQKYKFFLETNKSIHERPLTESQDFESKQNWPEIQDEVLPPDLLDDTNEITNPENSLSDVYSEKSDLDDGGYSLDIKPTALTDKKRSGKKQSSSKGGKIFTLIVFLLLIIAGGAWFFLYINKEIIFDDQMETMMPQDQIVIREPLQGKFIENNGNPKAFFVLQGNIKSGFPLEADIHRILIKGLLYKNQSEAVSSGTSFAGINLTLSQLRSFSEKEIRAYQKSQLKTGQQSLRLTGNTLPFQIIFFDVPAKIYKMEAKIFSYRKGEDKYELSE